MRRCVRGILGRKLSIDRLLLSIPLVAIRISWLSIFQGIDICSDIDYLLVLGAFYLLSFHLLPFWAVGSAVLSGSGSGSALLRSLILLVSLMQVVVLFLEVLVLTCQSMLH